MLWLLQWAAAVTPQEQADLLAIRYDADVQSCLAVSSEEEVTVRFRLKSGTIRGYRTLAGSREAGECLREKMSAWRFPSALWGPVKALTVRRAAPIPPDAMVSVTIRSKTPMLKLCYDTALEEAPDTRGRVVLQWTVHAGEVRDLAVRDDEVGSATLTKCLTEVVTSWEFPSILSTDVVWPFTFSPRVQSAADLPVDREQHDASDPPDPASEDGSGSSDD